MEDVVEWNVVRKSPGNVFRVALVYPNLYKAGMSNLGLQTIYILLNSHPEIYCERFFLDVEKSIETSTPLSKFDVILFSWQFELDAVNILNILRRAGINIERGRRKNFVVVGGPCAVNPVPLEPYVDAFFIGEAEVSLLQIILALKQGASPEEIAQIPGVYLPGVSSGAKKVMLRDLDSFVPKTQVVSTGSAYPQAYLLEVVRGCHRGCRFCMGGYIFRPRRERRLTTLEEMAEWAAKSHAKSLIFLGASVTDYSDISGLAELMSRAAEKGFELRAPSLRADSATLDFLSALTKGGQRTITIAPESSERLRFALNKNITDEKIIEFAEKSKKAGFNRMKLYFILGIPGETKEDLEQIAKLTKNIRDIGFKLKLSVNPLIPKPHSALQWAEFCSKRDYQRALKFLAKNIIAEIKAESYRYSLLQTLIARGDEKISRVLSFVESLSMGDWRKAMKKASVDIEEYTSEVPLDLKLPWEKIDTLVSRKFLEKEYTAFKKL